jgi:integrase
MPSVRESKLPENVRQRGRQYYFRCRINGKQKDIPLGSDLSVARRLAKQHAGRIAGIKSGLEHPDTATWEEAERRPISEHVEEWHKHVINKGDCAHYAGQVPDRVNRLIELSGIQRISGLSLCAIETAMAGLKRDMGRRGNKALSDRTIFHYHRAIRGFSKWLWERRRTREDMLARLKAPEMVKFMERRALQPEEIAAVIEATRTQPRRASIEGPDRAILYATAAGTGLRIKELTSLTPENFCLNADPPTITCSGDYTKNGKTAVQPICPELAEMLRPWLEGKPLGEPVFVLDRDQIARMLRKDLKAAGVRESESYDFHCLRHSYITAVVKSGCSLKVAQELARHSDPKLTLKTYSHLTVHDLAQGLQILSHTLPTLGVSAGLTGTCGGSRISSPGLTQRDPLPHRTESV